MEFINYAHRGASAYAPENTFASFYLGQRMGANGIETDVRRTLDGVAVIYHDLEIPYGGKRVPVASLTYEQLLSVDIGLLRKGEEYAGERTVTFEEFIRHFGSKKLHLAIEIKHFGVEGQVACLMRRYACPERVIVTSFERESLEAMRGIAPEYRLGYLVHEVTDEILDYSRRMGFFQICPMASALTEETCEKMRREGFSVRAWGVKDETLMRKMLDLGVDGMTVNFPDKLIEALKQR